MAQPSALYQGQEFPVLRSSWSGSPETLLNLSFTSRIAANARNKKARELKISGDNSLQAKWKYLFCVTPKEAKSSYTVQSRAGCLGCQEHTIPLAVSRVNYPAICSDWMGFSCLPQRAKYTFNLEGLLLYFRKTAGKAEGTLKRCG